MVTENISSWGESGHLLLCLQTIDDVISSIK